MHHPPRVRAEAEVPSGSASFHLSGQHRLLYGHTSAPDLGVARRAATSVGLLRNLLGLELRIPRLAARLQTQVGAHYAFGTPERAGPPDADWGDVHLLFAEWTRAGEGPKRVSVQLRVGRQEMALGSTRWFSARDGTNVRQAWDIVRLSVWTDRVIAHGFAGLLPRLRRGLFDDAPDPWSRVVGGYVTVHALADDRLSVDLF
ncbi:MAG TPA: alginate export family protein, partial [Polyangiales bacterium]